MDFSSNDPDIDLIRQYMGSSDISQTTNTEEENKEHEQEESLSIKSQRSYAKENEKKTSPLDPNELGRAKEEENKPKSGKSVEESWKEGAKDENQRNLDRNDCGKNQKHEGGPRKISSDSIQMDGGPVPHEMKGKPLSGFANPASLFLKEKLQMRILEKEPRSSDKKKKPFIEDEIILEINETASHLLKKQETPHFPNEKQDSEAPSDIDHSRKLISFINWEDFSHGFGSPELFKSNRNSFMFNEKPEWLLTPPNEKAKNHKRLRISSFENKSGVFGSQFFNDFQDSLVENSAEDKAEMAILESKKLLEEMNFMGEREREKDLEIITRQLDKVSIFSFSEDPDIKAIEIYLVMKELAKEFPSLNTNGKVKDAQKTLLNFSKETLKRALSSQEKGEEPKSDFNGDGHSSHNELEPNLVFENFKGLLGRISQVYFKSNALNDYELRGETEETTGMKGKQRKADFQVKKNKEESVESEGLNRSNEIKEPQWESAAKNKEGKDSLSQKEQKSFSDNGVVNDLGRKHFRKREETPKWRMKRRMVSGRKRLEREENTRLRLKVKKLKARIHLVQKRYEDILEFSKRKTNKKDIIQNETSQNERNQKESKLGFLLCLPITFLVFFVVFLKFLVKKSCKRDL